MPAANVRVAAGSGTSVQDVNKVLKMHRQMADMMKKLGKGGMKGLAGMLGGGLLAAWAVCTAVWAAA